MGRFLFVIIIAIMILISASEKADAQSYDGQVLGTLTGGIHKYFGEFTDDLWGPGGMISIQFAPISRLQVEARFGLGEIRWKITPTDLARFPDYFGQGAEFGDPYPGTLTSIETENESRLTTIDLLVNYVIVDDIPAVPFISAGVGYVSFAPSNGSEHDALPNYGAGVFSGSTVSFPVGGGVKIPFSDRVGLMLRGEHRFVLSPYLDDLNVNGSNDAVTSVQIGLTYSFTEPPHRNAHPETEVYYYDRKAEPRAQPRAQPTPEPAQSAQPVDADKDTEPAADSAAEAPLAAAPLAVPANIEPCAEGLARICVAEDQSVCVDTTFVPGTDRIKWENAFVFDKADPAHQTILKDAGSDTPCYSSVIRQMKSSYYQCIDCCFEKIKLGGNDIYVLLEEGILAKGDGVFTPEECPDCETVASEGR